MILYVYSSVAALEIQFIYASGMGVGDLTALIIAIYWELFAVEKTSITGEVYRDIFALSSLFFAASFLIALTLPDIGVKLRNKGDYFSVAVLKKNWDIYFGFFPSPDRSEQCVGDIPFVSREPGRKTNTRSLQYI